MFNLKSIQNSVFSWYGNSVVTNFFEKIISFNTDKKFSIILVLHIVPDIVDFLEFISKYFTIEYIIPKQKSINKDIYEILEKKYIFLEKDKDFFYNDKKWVIDIFSKINNDFIIIDIWWYFSKISVYLKEVFWNQFLWIVEDTENWIQKYEKNNTSDFLSLFSVARSDLKIPEDLLVWQSIVFTVSYILRKNNILLNNKNIWIIWFWKIWESIAENLRWNNINIWINDISSVKWVKVISSWYNFFDKKDILEKSDIIFCATWNISLRDIDFWLIKNWTIICTVTSSDDELDIKYLNKNTKHVKSWLFIDEYQFSNWKFFYLLNNWSTVNFIKEFNWWTRVWFFITLVQAEILSSIWYLIKWDSWKNKILEISNNDKENIAIEWIKSFYN